jgi:pimeloyl-ACP methyl ester carboxylesterase
MKRYIFLIIFCLPVLTTFGQRKLPIDSSYYNPRLHVYQYSVNIGTRKAYLWVPPDCKYVRGVIVALSNMLERQWLEDAEIRRTATQTGLGIIWIGPAKRDDRSFTADMKPGMELLFQKMLDDFTTISGFRELRTAPVLPMGHSANGHFAWTFANAMPERTIAVIPIKTIPFPDSLKFKDIPFCYVVAQTTEWPQYRVPDPATKPGDRDFYWPVVRNGALALRAQNADNLISVVTDPGGGHFDWSPRLSAFVALYIRKACAYRLPPAGQTGLRPIKKENGWLTGTGGMDKDEFQPAPYLKYKGGPANGYWFFDEETAKAGVDFEGDRIVRKKQMLSFVQDGKLLPVAKIGYAELKFKPEADGRTFTLQGGFLSVVPPELIDRGDTLGHNNNPISFRVITGPAIQSGPNTFKVQFDRGGQDGSIYIQESVAADKNYRHAVQPGMMRIPAKLTEGLPQHITFPDADTIIRQGKYTIRLNAISDAGLPVEYYIDAGPAFIEKGNLLHIYQVPQRTRYPIKITIVAYQWGRSIPPLYQSAEPVIRTYYILKKTSARKK